MLIANAATHIPATAATTAILRNREHSTNRKRKTLTPGLNLTTWIRQFVAPIMQTTTASGLSCEETALTASHDNWELMTPRFYAPVTASPRAELRPSLMRLRAQFSPTEGCKYAALVVYQQLANNANNANIFHPAPWYKLCCTPWR